MPKSKQIKEVLKKNNKKHHKNMPKKLDLTDFFSYNDLTPTRGTLKKETQESE